MPRKISPPAEYEIVREVPSNLDWGLTTSRKNSSHYLQALMKLRDQPPGTAVKFTGNAKSVINQIKTRAKKLNMLVEIAVENPSLVWVRQKNPTTGLEGAIWDGLTIGPKTVSELHTFIKGHRFGGSAVTQNEIQNILDRLASSRKLVRDKDLKWRINGSSTLN